VAGIVYRLVLESRRSGATTAGTAQQPTPKR
jgi:hypothetical protein